MSNFMRVQVFLVSQPKSNSRPFSYSSSTTNFNRKHLQDDNSYGFGEPPLVGAEYLELAGMGWLTLQLDPIKRGTLDI